MQRRGFRVGKRLATPTPLRFIRDQISGGDGLDFFCFPLNRRRADKTKDRQTGSGRARRPPDDASFFAPKVPSHCRLSARPAWVSARELTRTLLPYLSVKGSRTSYSSAHSNVFDFSGVILQHWLLPCGKLSPSLNPIQPFQGTAG